MSKTDFVTRGQALVSAGQFQEAVKVCRLGLLGRPTTVEGRIVLGQALLALKRFDEVLVEMRVALELDHDSVPAQQLRVEALLGKGDSGAALGLLRALPPRAQATPVVMRLMDAAQRQHARPGMSASHSAVGFVGGDPASERTRHYPSHSDDDENTGIHAEHDPMGGHDTGQTSIAAPSSRQRAARPPVVSPPAARGPVRGPSRAASVPSADALAVGDRSGTVEVDPEADGIEIEGDDVAPPPSARGARGPVRGPAAVAAASARVSPRARPSRPEVSSVELDSADLIPDEPVVRPTSGSRMDVRRAGQLASAPIDQPTPASTRPTSPAQAIVQVPGMSPVSRGPSPGLGGAPGIPAPPFSLAGASAARPLQPPPGPIAAARPTALMPQPQPHPHPVHGGFAQVASAARPTLAFASPPGDWDGVRGQGGHAGMAYDSNSLPPGMDHDPRDHDARQPDPRQSMSPPPGSHGRAGSKVPHAGARRTRTRLQLFLWVVIGALVIGGGVVAGFQIRGLRLKTQIAAARSQAGALAKADTWSGWVKARSQLAGVARVAATDGNRAALARTRGVLAYEFGDGLREAQAALGKLGEAGGLEGALAAAYIALAGNDPAAARAAAQRASGLAAADPAVAYVTGLAALLEGDHRAAITNLEAARTADPRPLYGIGLARALAETGAFDKALAAVDAVLAASPGHPSAVIERARLLAVSGRLVAGTPVLAEVQAQLGAVLAEGARPIEAQPTGVSPAQVALANLAVARLAFARHDATATTAAVRASSATADDARYVEEAVETLLAVNMLPQAQVAAQAAISAWPLSRRAQVAEAQVVLALGKPTEALALLAKHREATTLPRGLAVRGHARLLTGDLEGARADFDAALVKLPKLELARTGRAWIDLADDDVAGAEKQLGEDFDPKSASPALLTLHAAILRRGDAAARATAKAQLETLVAGPPTLDTPRAQLEFGRLLGDLGELRAARAAFAEASRGGLPEARLESGLLMIEDKDPLGGRDTLDGLLAEAGEAASPRLLLEAARARMLVGDHAGGETLLARADKVASVERWHLERERGRLRLRRGDAPGAAAALQKALEGCGKDTETFLLAADAVTLDPTQTALDPTQTALAIRLEQLVPLRITGLPEAQIVAGKLALASGNMAKAEVAYKAAKAALVAASPRKLAQVHFGLAAIAYDKKDDPAAQNELSLVMAGDPTIYEAYLYAAALENKPATALALARKATAFNPDSVKAWLQVGQLASTAARPKELAEAITRLEALAPKSEALATLLGLR